jgi:hypothetical protein
LWIAYEEGYRTDSDKPINSTKKQKPSAWLGFVCSFEELAPFGKVTKFFQLTQVVLLKIKPSWRYGNQIAKPKIHHIKHV